MSLRSRATNQGEGPGVLRGFPPSHQNPRGNGEHRLVLFRGHERGSAAEAAKCFNRVCKIVSFEDEGNLFNHLDAAAVIASGLSPQHATSAKQEFLDRGAKV